MKEKYNDILDMISSSDTEEEEKESKTGKRIIKTIIIIIILLLLSITISLGVTSMVTYCREKGIFFKEPNSMQVDSRATNISQSKKENILEGRNVYFSGIEDAVINKQTVVQLDNMKENEDFYMTYEIYDKSTGVLIFKTDLIPSGQWINWVPGESLDIGEHILDIKQIPYYEHSKGDFKSLTQGCNTVVFTIVEE